MNKIYKLKNKGNFITYLHDVETYIEKNYFVKNK